MKKRILSLLLCLLLCFSLLPMGAFAKELPNEPLPTDTPGEVVTLTAEAEEGYALSLLELDPETEYAENEVGSFSFIMPEADVTVSAVFAMPMLLGNLMAKEPVPYIYHTSDGSTAVRHDDGVCTDYEIVSSETTEWTDGWYVVDQDTGISNVTVNGKNVNLILKDNCTLTVADGITMIGSDCTLNIYGQSEGESVGSLVSGNRIGSKDTYKYSYIGIHGGRVTVTNKDHFFAAIGGRWNQVTIYNGTVTANSSSSEYSPGLDNVVVYCGRIFATGSFDASGIDNATIYDGEIHATGGRNASGIGNATIYDGEIHATGSGDGGGIGGTKRLSAEVKIYGGTIEAVGSGNCSGIEAYGSNIEIHGGDITATGGKYGYGAGIGIGRFALVATSDILITDGNITAIGGDSGCPGIGKGGNTGNQTVNITITGGTVVATGGTDAAGIDANLTVSGGMVTANAGGPVFGILGSVQIDGGTLFSAGGINASSVTVNDGYLEVNGCHYLKPGIAGGATTVNGGTVVARGDADAPGILCYSSLTDTYEVFINGGNVTAIGGENAAGIGGEYNLWGGHLTVTGGTVTAVAGSSDLLIPPRAIGYGGSAEISSNRPGTIDVAEGVHLIDNITDTLLEKGDGENWTDVLDGGSVSFTAVSGAATYREYNTAAGNYDTKTCADSSPMLSTSTVLNSGWYAVYKNIVLDSVSIQGDVHLILADGCTMTVKHGLHVNEGNSLTIYDQPDVDGQSDEKGKLDSSIKGPDGSEKLMFPVAGIGGDKDNNCGNITIHGGTIIAEGGNDAAGIGGGRSGSGGTVTIYGGNVTAIGSSSAAGIGGGRGSGCGNITINGGNIVALALWNGAGIGTGEKGYGGSVTINGGAVTANSTDLGAGIGTGAHGRGVSVTINGGAVTASGTDLGAGIGAGADGSNVNVTITGGTVTATGGVAMADGYGAGICAENLSVCGGIVDATGGENAKDGIVADNVVVSPRPGACMRVKTEDENELDGSPFTQVTDITTRLSGHAKVHFDDIISYIYYTLDGNTAVRHDGGECTGFITVTDATSIFENGKWYVVLESISNNNRINVNGTAHLILANGATLNATSGIEVSENSTLNIYAQSAGENMGALNASGYKNAGIGSNATTGTVNIHGGKVTANGGAQSAGIGGGGGRWRSGGGSVTIYDGKVTAKCGQNNAAGIGGGWTGNGADVKIYGGEVIASNYDSEGNGIGAGWGGENNGTLFLADGVTFGAGDDADNITVTGDKNNASDAFGHAYFVTPYQHDHTYNQKVVEEKYLKSAATCTDAEVYYKSCTCGEASSTDTFTSGKPLGHSFPETWDQYNAEQHKHTCTRCGTEVEYEAHTWDDGKITTPTTHLADGVKTYTCTKCGETKTETIDKLKEHTFDQKVADAKYLKSVATNTEAAVYYKSCICGEASTTETFTSGNLQRHTYGEPAYEWTDDKCTATHICTVCTEETAGHTETETVTGTYVKDTDATCTTAESGHYEATFQNKAFTAQQTAAGSVVKGVPLGHSFPDTWDQHNAEQHKHICTRCKTEIEYEAHTWDDGKITTPATHLADGVKTYTCTKCGETKTETIDKLTEHTFDQKVVDAKFLKSVATNTEAAVYYKSCICGEASTIETFTSGNPQGDTYADHNFDGNTCKDCGYVKVSDYIIIVDSNGVWTKGSTAGRAFTFNAPFAKFDSVKVDGSTIAATNYSAEEGSTKITLASAYLETLSIGSHSIVVVSTDGTASMNFTVKAAIPPVPTTYTVTFNMNGHGIQITAQSVESGSKAMKPAEPKASGYTFGGWYADATCSTKFDFNTAITANTTVYAKWTKNSVAPADPTTPQTGDNSNMFLWIALLFVSGGALVGTTVYGKKRKRAE